MTLSHVTYCLKPRPWRTCGPELVNLNRPTQSSALVKVFINFTNVIDWLPRTILQLLLVLQNSIQLGGRSVDKRKTYLNQVDLSWFNACSEDLPPRLSSLGLTSESLKWLSLHIPSVLWRQRYSNTEGLRISAVSSHISRQHSEADLTETNYTRSLTDNRMSCQYHA